MKNFNPRHLRKKYRNKSGPGDSALASPALAAPYAAYCEATGKGTGFRKG